MALAKEDKYYDHNHDGRYYTKTALENGELDDRYYTETEAYNLFIHSGGIQLPLFSTLTQAGTADTRPQQMIITSGNTDGSWVWISIYGGSTYQWTHVASLTGV